MCCRYWADESPEIREIVEEMKDDLDKRPVRVGEGAIVNRWEEL